MPTKAPPPDQTAARYLSGKPDLDALRERAKTCTACDLYQRATQTVFGEGREGARLMLVGEQPGSDEDLAGRPFVGPAGRLLDKVLAEAGIDRRRVYVTNAVKHFKWEETSGKRRIHAKPNAKQIAACRPWLEAEIARVKPEVLVCLGATAAQTLLGRDFKVTERRGQPVRSTLAPHVMATIHPSAILRSPDDDTRRKELARFTAELRALVPLLG